MDDERQSTRRSVLGLTGGLLGTALLGGAGWAAADASSAESNDSARDAPSVEWYESYTAEEHQFQEQDYKTVLQADDGGFVVAGEARPVEKSGAENPEFIALKTDAAGEPQWTAFAEPPGGNGDFGEEAEYGGVIATDGTTTTDRGTVLVGYGDVQGSRANYESKYVAHAAKVTGDGEVAWTRTIDPQREGGEPTGAYSFDAEFQAVVPAHDGGVVAAGQYTTPGEESDPESHAWLVKFTADGETAWERYYRTTFDGVAQYGDGYVAFAAGKAVVTDASGRERRTVTLEIPYSMERELVPTADGGFAFTVVRSPGDSEERNLLLGRLDENGDRQWLTEYDGPAGSEDRSHDVVQTEDGGFALTGFVSEAYSTDPVAVFLGADEEGTERWRTTVEEADRMDDLIRTADGGFAGQGGYGAVKLTAAGADDSAGTATATPSPTAAPTEEGAATATPEEADDGEETETDGEADDDCTI